MAWTVLPRDWEVDLSVAADYRCPECGFEARHAMGLGRHRTARHGMVSQRAAREGRTPARSADRATEYRCDDCGFIARHAMGLGRHRSARHGYSSKKTQAALALAEPAGDSDELKAWIPRREAATRAGVHLNTIRNWHEDGRLPTRKVPGSRELHVDVAALDGIVAERGSGRLQRRSREHRAQEPVTGPSPAPAIDSEFGAERARGIGREVYACNLTFAEDPRIVFSEARILVLADALQTSGLASASIAHVDEGQVDRPGPVHLRWRTLRDGDDAAWTLVGYRPHERDADLRWRLDAKIVCEHGRSWGSFRLSLQPLGARMVPVHLAASAPSAIELLLRKFDVIADGRRLSTEPTVVSSMEMEDVVALLTHPDRELPVVVVSRERSTNRALVDPGSLARALAGLAHVVTFDTADTSFSLTDALGDKRSVFMGAVRIYWPGFSLHADPWTHPLYLPDRIATEGRSHGGFERLLLQQIVPVAAMHSPISDVEKRLHRRASELQRAPKQLPATRNAAPADSDWQAELERAWAEEERLRAQVAELEVRLAQTEAALHRALLGPSPEDDKPRTVAEATERAAKFAAHLEFLPEAFQSAWASPYAQPEKILRALLTLDEVAAAYAEGEIGRSIKAECEARGLPYRSDTSKTARGKYGHEYRRTYNGRTIELGPHIAFGTGSPRTCARIYFFIDQDDRRFIIGHVGSHLRDTRTG